jgi:hypothetical protein
VISLNAITNGRLIRGLIRSFGMKVSGSPAPTLAPEVSPGYEINNWDDYTQPFLQMTRLQSCFQAGTPGAGNHVVFQLRNPANSGVLLVVEAISSFATIQLGLILTSSNLGTVTSTSLRDFRWFRPGLQQQGAGIASTEFTPAPIFPTAESLQGTQQIARSHWVIPPGAALIATTVVAVTPNTVTFFWREPLVAAEELSNG